MAKFQITAPDGRKFVIEGETQEGALAALQSHLGASEPAAAPQASQTATTAPQAAPAPAAAPPLGNRRGEGESVEAYRARLASQAGSDPRSDASRQMDAQSVSGLTGTPQAVVPAEPSYTVIATGENGGRFMRDQSGAVSYTSPGYSTTDPDTVARLMEGATPADIQQTSFDQQRINANPTLARVNEVARGLPFVGSYTDEVADMIDPGRGENLRALSGAMHRENPVESAVANVGGAVLGSIPAAVAAGPTVAANASQTIGGKALQALGLGAVVGGVEGAIYGAGEGEGEGVMDSRAANAAVGGGLGAAIGGGTGVLAPYAAAGLKHVVRAFRGSDIGTIAKELGVSTQAATVIRNAIESGDDDAAMAALRQGGDSSMLADANQATRSLLDTAAQAPGAAGDTARNAIAERTTGQTRALVARLDDILGSPQGSQDIIDEIRTTSAGPRQQAYDAAYAAPIDYAAPDGRRIESLMNRVPESAIRRANALMRLEGSESAQIMARIGDAGEVTFEVMPDVRQLDYITRALNDVASEADGAGKLGGQTDLGRGYANLSRQIRQSVRRAVPEYGTALDTAADAISQRNGVDIGREMLRGGFLRQDMARALSGASDAEKAAMRQGLRSYIDDVTAGVSRTIMDSDTEAREGIRMMREFSSRSNRSKLRMLLGPEDAQALADQVDEAATAFELRAAIAQNSKTASRQMVDGAVRQQTDGGILRTIGAGEPVNAAKLIVQTLTGETAEAQEIRRMGLYSEIADALVSQRGPNARRALEIINRVSDGELVSEHNARFIANVIVGSGATAAVPATRQRALSSLAQ